MWLAVPSSKFPVSLSEQPSTGMIPHNIHFHNDRGLSVDRSSIIERKASSAEAADQIGRQQMRTTASVHQSPESSRLSCCAALANSCWQSISSVLSLVLCKQLKGARRGEVW